MNRAILFAVAILATGCAGTSSVAASANQPAPVATPAPTPVPWALTVPKAVYSKQVGVGDTIEVTVTVKNTGKAANPATLINFSDLDKYADLFDCKPECTTEDLSGLGPSAILPGVAAGKTSSFVVNFVAAKVGAVKWSLCVYDDRRFNREVWCGDASTAIR